MKRRKILFFRIFETVITILEQQRQNIFMGWNVNNDCGRIEKTVVVNEYKLKKKEKKGKTDRKKNEKVGKRSEKNTR